MSACQGDISMTERPGGRANVTLRKLSTLIGCKLSFQQPITSISESQTNPRGHTVQYTGTVTYPDCFLSVSFHTAHLTVYQCLRMELENVDSDKGPSPNLLYIQLQWLQWERILNGINSENKALK